MSEYRKVALHRLHDALELLQDPTMRIKGRDASTRHLRGAMYLAGYAVECVLKALIIARNPPCRTLGDVDGSLVIAEGHNLDLLLTKAGLNEHLGDHTRDWRLCRTWNPDWRYEPNAPKRGEAVNFINAAQRVHTWIKNMV